MASERMTVARAMVKALEAEGITTVFGYPGAAICPFYDELISSDIRHVLVRHEVNGGHAASGYARMTGKPAVAIATSGPGATNLITAIATAHMDSIPMVLITGQVSCEQIGRDVFQEADITGAAEPFVKHSYLVKDPAEMPVIFKNAFYIAGSGRPGPVLIDMPFDVQKAVIDFEYPKTVDIRSYKPSIQGNKLQIKRAVAAIIVSLCASIRLIYTLLPIIRSNIPITPAYITGTYAGMTGNKYNAAGINANTMSRNKVYTNTSLTFLEIYNAIKNELLTIRGIFS